MNDARDEAVPDGSGCFLLLLVFAAVLVGITLGSILAALGVLS